MRIPQGLVAYGGRPGCGIDIIGPGRRCPNTALGEYTHASWRGWVVGSSIAGEQHLVITASPDRLRNYAKVVNGPAWYPAARVRPLAWMTINGWHMRAVFVPPETNDGSAFAHHVVLIWTVGQHTYGVGFHEITTVRETLLLDEELAQHIELVRP
jgi:hypothetical protein